MVLLLLLAAVPSADAGVPACKEPPPDELVTVKLKAATLGALLDWASPILCDALEASEADRKKKLTATVAGQVRAGDVRTLVMLLARAAQANVLGTRAAPGPCPELLDQVRSTAPDVYEVKAKAFAEVLDSQSCLMSSARLVPSMKNGVMQGFKLFSIRPGSPLALVGLKNGDTVEQVNGLAVTTPAEAMAAFEKLKVEKHFVLEGDRRGAPFKLTVDVK